MPLRRGLHALIALVAVLLIGLAQAEATFAIGLDQSVSGVVATDAAAHVYLLDVPAGSAGFTIGVRGEDRDANLAVYFGDEEILYDASVDHDANIDPNPVWSVANPRAGTYRIVVANLLAEDLAYVLTVEVHEVAATEPIWPEPCETDGKCRAP